MQGFPVTIEITPRFRDTDAMGHVNNAVYLTYFEIARSAYWAELTGERRYDRVPFILAHASADFRSPVRVEERMRVGMRIVRLGRSSFDAEYRVETVGGARLVAEGRSVMVMYDYARHASIPIPEELRARVRTLENRPDL